MTNAVQLNSEGIAATDDLTAGSAIAAPVAQVELISKDALKALLVKSNARGWVRLAGHLLIMAGCATLYAWCVLAKPTGIAWSSYLCALPAGVAFGFTLVTMFACMHETVHRTAFKSTWANDGVAWFAGLLSFYNSTFYRHYHGWHHRFTQIPGKDPELEDAKPENWWQYVMELSAVGWWIGKLKTYARVCVGAVAGYPYIPEKARGEVIRSVRLQMAVYLAAIAVSALLLWPWFVVFWLLPVAVAQPFLRAIVLAEHTGCSRDDNAMTNTRTTYTVWPIRYLMWDMPYHVEHHRYPALPFHALATMHERLKPHETNVASSYIAAQRAIAAGFA